MLCCITVCWMCEWTTNLGGEVKLMGGHRWHHRHGDSSRGGDVSLSVSRLHALIRQNQEVRSSHRTDVLAREQSRFTVHGPEPPACLHTKTHTHEQTHTRKYSVNSHWQVHKQTHKQQIPKQPAKKKTTPTHRAPNQTHRTQECLSSAPPAAWPSSSRCSRSIYLNTHTRSRHTHTLYRCTKQRTQRWYCAAGGGSYSIVSLRVSPVPSPSMCCSLMMSPLWKLSRLLSSVM